MNQSGGTRKKNNGREISEFFSGISAKLIQYLMLVLLLVLVFLVSAYAGLARRGQRNDDSGKGAARLTDAAECGDEKTDEVGGMEGKPAEGRTDGEGQDEGEKGKAEESDGTEKGTIVLDAGHGGFDPGVSGASGVSERELNLILAKKLETLLAEEGYHVVQTRPTEAGLYDEDQTHKKAQDMQRRCAVIEAAQPLATISIHQNSYPDDSSVAGPQVFYYAQSKEGEHLAACIQNCMNEQLAVERPKSHKGNESYYILKRSAGTAVIVECGFLTNPEEEKKLQNEAYQDEVVCAIRDGILQYLDGLQTAAPIV